MKRLLFEVGKIIVPPKYRQVASRSYYKARNFLVRGSTDFFNVISIETNTRCNRRCEYCPNKYYDRGMKNEFMPEGLYKKIIDQLKELKYNGRVTPSFYNEPLLDPRLENLIEYTRKKLPQAQIVVFSNGDYLNRERFDNLIKAGVDTFVLTQHGKIINPKFDKFLKSLNTEDKKHIDFKKLTEDSELSNRGGEVTVKKLLNTQYIKSCDQPSNAMQIDYQGNVALCCNDYHSSIKFGNVNNERIIDIWKKPAYEKIRKDTMKGIFNLKICQVCVGMAKPVKHKTKK